MGKTRKSFAFLCLATLSLGFGLVGCTRGGENSGDDSGKKEAATWTVTFDSQGGSAVATQTVKNGEKVVKPADPTKENYDFVNWYEDKVGVTLYDFDTAVTASFTLYAKWKASSGPGPQPGPVNPIENGACVKVGSTIIELETYDSGDTATGAWKKEGFAAEAGDEVVFYYDAAVLSVFSDGTSSGNNITEAHPMSDPVQSVHIKTGGASLSVYLKQYGETYTFWITGAGSGPAPQPGENVTYTLTCTNDWDITAANATFFVWAWGEGVDGQWFTPERAEKVFTVELPTTVNKCKVVRMDPAKSNPSWDAKWNESNEISLDSSSPTASFAFGN